MKTKPEDELDDWNLEQLEWLGDYEFEYFSVDDTNAVLWKQFSK